MVKQGDIIKVSFNTDSEQEQQGSYPAIVISNNEFNKRTKLAVVCPITNTDNKFPLHVSLDSRTKTTGVILCEHLRTLDLNARKCKVVEKAPSDILFRNVVRCEDIVSIHRGIHMHTASEKTHSRFPAGGLPDVGLVSDRQKSTAHIKRTVQQQLSCGNHSKQIHQIRPGIIPNWISDIILIRFLF